MLHNIDRVMSRLLGLFVLTSLCSAMLPQNSLSSEEDNSSTDPNSYNLGSAEGFNETSGEFPPWEPFNGPRPLQGKGNDTKGFNRLRAGDGDILNPIPDMTICQTLMNAPIPPPIDQIPFFCLCPQCKGTVGPKGDRGDRGPPGFPGSPGIRGVMGFRGRPGFTGPPGIKGQKGDMGEKGMSGVAGFTGSKGDRGFKGEKGDRGLMGPPGSQGPQGEHGTCPATCETVQGPPGEQGPPGPAGGRGLPGVKGSMGPSGFKGDKGDMGIPGIPGVDGRKGDQGEQGVCECTDGEDGRDGRPGDMGPKGDKGDPGVRGEVGPTGPKGNQGMTGQQGLPGPCSIQIQSAFCAAMNESFPPPNRPIRFGNIFTNMQGHYRPETGMYTAPVNGTYIFSYHLAVAQRSLKVGLYLNLYPLIRTTEGNDQATASQTIVLRLKAGDQVWLQVKTTETNGIFTDPESSSTFSGYLLYPDNCEARIARNYNQLPPKGSYSWDGPPHHSTTTTPQPRH